MSSAIDRRTFLRTLGGAASLIPLSGLANCTPAQSQARVVVIGGGFGGSTAAKYIRLWDPSIQVTLIERRPRFTSCPMSNLVLSGLRNPGEIEHGYDALAGYGVNVVHDDAYAVYPDRKSIRLASGAEVVYDRLIMSPGIDFVFDEVVGCEAAIQAGQVFHAWRPGTQTEGLRSQLEAMEDGGVFIMTIPEAPYRCPPGPYERMCLVADYFQREKPRSKVLVFDANPEIVSKSELFRTAWAERYPEMIEYVPGARPEAVDGEATTVTVEGEVIEAGVLNVIPQQRAGEIAARAGLVAGGEHWCAVDWRTCESLAVPDIHVLGDATASAPGMPKSGHMANAQAKVCAGAVIDLLGGRPPDPDPVLTNTCYSFVSSDEAMHVASVHRWDPEHTTVTPVPEAGGLSPAPNADEANHAWGWAQNIWADALG